MPLFCGGRGGKMAEEIELHPSMPRVGFVIAIVKPNVAIIAVIVG